MRILECRDQPQNRNVTKSEVEQLFPFPRLKRPFVKLIFHSFEIRQHFLLKVVIFKYIVADMQY